MQQKIGTIKIEKDENQFVVCWRIFSGQLIFSCFIAMIPISLVLYPWGIHGVHITKQMIQDPSPGMVFETILIWLFGMFILGLGAYPFFYKEKFRLDVHGLEWEKTVLFWKRKKFIPLNNLRPFEYKSNASSIKGRRKHYCLVIVFRKNNHPQAKHIKSPFGMCWNKRGIQLFCEELNQFLEKQRNI